MVCYCFHIGQYHASDKVTLHLHVLPLRPILILFYHLHLASHLSIHLIHSVTNFFTFDNCSHVVYNVRNIIGFSVCYCLIVQDLLFMSSVILLNLSRIHKLTPLPRRYIMCMLS
jgi:hypothetical protein